MTQVKHIEDGKVGVETEAIKNLLLTWLMVYGSDWVSQDRVASSGVIGDMQLRVWVLYLHSYIQSSPDHTTPHWKLTPKSLQIINHGLQVEK
jgi:hypothetical protein